MFSLNKDRFFIPCVFKAKRIFNATMHLFLSRCTQLAVHSVKTRENLLCYSRVAIKLDIYFNFKFDANQNKFSNISFSVLVIVLILAI